MHNTCIVLFAQCEQQTRGSHGSALGPGPGKTAVNQVASKRDPPRDAMRCPSKGFTPAARRRVGLQNQEEPRTLWFS